MDTGKRNYFSFDKNSYKEDKILHQKQESFTFELTLIPLYQLNCIVYWVSSRQEKMLQSQTGLF